jgi:hypothetical protein
MKGLIVSLTIAAATAFVPAASASTMFSAKISNILISDTLVYVYPATSISGAPGCVIDSTYYSFAQTRPAAKQFVAALLAAMAQNASVDFWGAGACTDQGYSETLNFFKVAAP